jgi:hypothetical protein
MSGYLPEGFADIIARHHVRLLRKPFTVSVLAEQLASLLDEKRSTTLLASAD